MATTVHLPANLLESVDQHARDLGVSRNRFIIHALERALSDRSDWSPRFLRELETASTDAEGQDLVDEMTRAITSRRTSKAGPDL